MRRALEEVAPASLLFVCKDYDVAREEAIIEQTGEPTRVLGIVDGPRLSRLFDKCLTGPFAKQLGLLLLNRLRQEFNAEFPYAEEFPVFYNERGYDAIVSPPLWSVES